MKDIRHTFAIIASVSALIWVLLSVILGIVLELPVYLIVIDCALVVFAYTYGISLMVQYISVSRRNDIAEREA